MRFLADENIPAEAIALLRASGFDLASVTETMAGATDRDVLLRANLEGRIIITFDKGFAELVFQGRLGVPAGVILLRVRPQSPVSVAELLVNLLGSGRVWQGHFSVVTDKRIRMVRLPDL